MRSHSCASRIYRAASGDVIRRQRRSLQQREHCNKIQKYIKILNRCSTKEIKNGMSGGPQTTMLQTKLLLHRMYISDALAWHGHLEILHLIVLITTE